MGRMKRAYWLIAASLCLLAPGFGRAQVKESVVFSAPEQGLEVVDTATDAEGRHLMMALRLGESTGVYLDGQKLDEVARTEHLSVLPDGRWAFAWVDGDSYYLVTPEGTAGPFESLSMPPSERLIALRTVQADEWAYRGGSRVAMGSRGGDGGWVALLRFPASPGNQEVRPLGTVRQVTTGTDPWAFGGAPNRFSWVGRNPVSVIRKGERECFVVGTKTGECGQRIALFVPAPAGDKLVYAVQREGSLLVVHPWGALEVKGRLDWVSFDASGEHLLMGYEADGKWALWLDGKVVSTWSTLFTAFWSGTGAWVAGGTEGGKSWVAQSDGSRKGYPGLEGVALSPKGEVLPLGNGPLGPYVGEASLAGQARELWGLGFVPAGTAYAMVTRADGAGQAVWFGGKVSAAFPRVRAIAASPKGDGLVSLGEKDREATVLVGADGVGSVKGEVDRMVWCGERPFPVTESEKGVCVGMGASPVCCPSLLGVACTDTGVRLLCKGEAGASWVEADGKPGASLGEVLPSLLVRTRWGVLDAFASRLAAEWSVRQGDQVVVLPGPARQALAGADGAWISVSSGKSMAWWHGGKMDAPAIRLKPPFYVGEVAFYWGLFDQGESWVVKGENLATVGRILGTPVAFQGGFYYWARREGMLELRKVEGL